VAWSIARYNGIESRTRWINVKHRLTGAGYDTNETIAFLSLSLSFSLSLLVRKEAGSNGMMINLNSSVN
jgi:hypothetical protein